MLARRVSPGVTGWALTLRALNRSLWRSTPMPDFADGNQRTGTALRTTLLASESRQPPPRPSLLIPEERGMDEETASA